MRSLAFGVLLLLIVPGLQGQATVPLFGRTKAPIALLRQSWIEDFEAGRILSWVGRYAPDATLSSPDGTHLEGIVAIRTYFAGVFAKYGIAARLTSRTTSESGDLAYDSGEWTETITDAATRGTSVLHGDYLTIYHRESANRWLIVQQVWTQAPAAGAVGR